MASILEECVWSRNLEKEEAKTHYRAVKNTTAMCCNARKVNKHNRSLYRQLISEEDTFLWA